MITKHLFKFEAMTTPCEVMLLSGDASRARICAQAILEEAKRLEKKYSYYDRNSYLSQINRRTLNILDNETKDILKRAIGYSRKTNGCFDITYATIKDIYVGCDSLAALQRGIEELSPYIGSEHIEIKRDKIYFDNLFTKIDLGGFVKELAVDNAVKLVRKMKIKTALINFGGDIYALGRKKNGQKFRIGVKNPDNPAEHIRYFEIENKAIATSASYERNYTVAGKNFSHILSKNRTNLHVKSVSVISDTCVESGVYATALMTDPTIKTKNRIFIIS